MVNRVFHGIVILGLLLSSAGYSQRKASISPKFCVDLSGSHKANAMGQSSSLNIKTGVAFGLEIARNTGETFNFGLGLLYLVPRELEVTESGNFNFVPVYALGKISLVSKEESIIPSLIANIGYNVIYNGDSNYKGPLNLKGGLYIGGGLRLDIEKFFLEGTYKSFSGSATYSDVTFDVTYTTFSVGAGLNL